MVQRNWEAEWTDIIQQKTAALECSQRYQAEVMAHLRSHRPPPMKLLREADQAAAGLQAAKHREESFLREWRASQGVQTA